MQAARQPDHPRGLRIPLEPRDGRSLLTVQCVSRPDQRPGQARLQMRQERIQETRPRGPSAAFRIEFRLGELADGAARQTQGASDAQQRFAGGMTAADLLVDGQPADTTLSTRRLLRPRARERPGPLARRRIPAGDQGPPLTPPPARVDA